MATTSPHYVIQKIGDQYVPVLQEPYPGMTRATYIGWGALLCYLGMQRSGLTRAGLVVAGLGVAARGVSGPGWVTALLTSVHPRPRDGHRNEGPSYQNDFRGRSTQLPVDAVDEQGMESFPASDPPARTATSHAG